MKQIVVLFLALATMFSGTWIYKAKNPIDRNDAAPVNAATVNWWEQEINKAPAADADWQLDPEIPQNYKPVPGQRNMFMVVDSDGKITGYRVREKQADGSWLWKDINPDIPENYEAVDGLKDVYRVKSQDGTVTYYKYIRNDDNTYAFIEVDEHGNLIADDPKGSEIPENYKLVQDNIYAVYNEHGVRIGYKQRIVDEDGNVTWKDVAAKKKPSAGERGEDTQSTTEIVTPNGNSGQSGQFGQIQNGTNGGGVSEPYLPVYGIPGDGGTGDLNRVLNADGTYTEKETVTQTSTSGGWTVTTNTIITRIYDANGNLIQTKKDGPYEVSKVLSNPGTISEETTTQVESTLSGELARVSAKVSYDSSTASSVLSLLNSDRAAAGLNELSSDPSLTSIAKIYAADMAIYDHADYNSSTYGTVGNLCSRYGISGYPSQNLWRTTSRSANDIHSRFQSMENMRSSRMDATTTKAGIAIVEQNGYQYICEVFM